MRPNAHAPSGLKRGRNWSEDEWRIYLSNYYLLIENTDWHIGLILRALKDAGAGNNTLVLFTSDHGDQMGSHQLVGKNILFEEAAKVPFAISWPGVVRSGQVRHDLVSGIDVLATLCDFTGIPIPEGVSGRSLRPLASGSQTHWRDYLVAETASGRMVRSRAHKYIAYKRERMVEHLFDLTNDPGEVRDLAAGDSAKGILDRHREMLAAWAKESGGGLER